MRRIAALAAAAALTTAACSWPSTSPATTTTAPATTTTSTTEPVDALSSEEQVEVAATVEALLAAWAAGDFPAVRAVSPDADHDLLGLHVAWTEGLGLRSAAYRVTRADRTADGIVAEYLATIDLGTAGVWEYRGSLDVAGGPGGWTVPWSARVIHPALEDGDTLFLERRWPERAAILGSQGITLVTERAVKTIGVVPEWIEDQEALLDALEEYADIPRSTVLRELRRPGVQPDWYLPVGWMPLVDFLPVQSQLEAVAGLDLRDDTARLAPAGPFADHVLGTTGEITADLLAEFGDPYRAGDIVGLSGLERELERNLAGLPTFEVQRINQFGRMLDVLHTVPGTAAIPVRTTLSVDVQLAAEAALADIELPAALVAIDAATGEIRAIASRPLDGFNRAALGLYPPGSTSKVVTSYGLLVDGLLPEDEVPCPAEVVVGGRTFTNAGDAERGDIPLGRALAVSCNTTFASLAAERLGSEGLADAAANFGYGSGYVLEILSAVPVFPDPAEEADVAAAGIGQGDIQVTPIHQATIAAAAASGTWRSPSILESAAAEALAYPLDGGAAGHLVEMMRLVVTSGTGTAADLAGEIVIGKTGSAEWSDGEPTHAWFIGAWEGLAFAVVVERGGAGGSAAAPIAAAFLERLAG